MISRPSKHEASPLTVLPWLLLCYTGKKSNFDALKKLFGDSFEQLCQLIQDITIFINLWLVRLCSKMYLNKPWKKSQLKKTSVKNFLRLSKGLPQNNSLRVFLEATRKTQWNKTNVEAANPYTLRGIARLPPPPPSPSPILLSYCVYVIRKKVL